MRFETKFAQDSDLEFFVIAFIKACVCSLCGKWTYLLYSYPSKVNISMKRNVLDTGVQCRCCEPAHK
jgi:hypothetical protein